MNPENNEKELMQMWQETALPQPFDPHRMAMEIAAKVHKFDRQIRWRNIREYVAGGAFLVWCLVLSAADTSKWNLTIPGMVAVAFVMIYLWRNQREARKPLDPTVDLNAYRAALTDRYDRQIELLSKAKYWYVLPIWLWLVLVGILVPVVKLPGGRPVYFIGATLFSAFVLWLNQSYGVRELRAARDRLQSL